MTPTTWGMMVALSLLWGGSFLFNRVAVLEVPTFTVVFFRVSIGATLLLVAAHASGIRYRLDRRTVTDFVVMGLLNNVVPFALIVWGQKSVGAGLASILNATTPIFGVVLVHLFTTDDRATPARVVGVLLGIVGVTVMMGVDLLAGLGDHIAGELACLGGAISYGFSALWSRRFRGSPPLRTAAGQLTASTAMMLPLMLAVDHPWTLALPSWPAIGSILGLAVISTAIAYVIFFRIMAVAGPTNVILVTLLIPPSAILLGAVFLGERLAPQHFLGIALIMLGLAAIDGRLARRVRAAAARPRP